MLRSPRRSTRMPRSRLATSRCATSRAVHLRQHAARHHADRRAGQGLPRDVGAPTSRRSRGTGPFPASAVTNAVTPTAPNGTPDYNYDIMGGLDATLTYDIDIAQAGRVRITNLPYAGAAVTPAQTFVVAINNYRQGGGGNFPHVKAAPVVYNRTVEIRQLMIDWVTTNKVIDPPAVLLGRLEADQRRDADHRHRLTLSGSREQRTRRAGPKPHGVFSTLDRRRRSRGWRPPPRAGRCGGRGGSPGRSPCWPAARGCRR